MSELDFRRVKHPDTGETITTENLIEGTPKAWANFNGRDTVSFRDSLNISSAVDHSTGSYEYNFINAWMNFSFSFSGMTSNDGTNLTRGTGGTSLETNNPPTTTAFRFRTGYGSDANANGAGADFAFIAHQMLGRLA